MFIVKHYPSTDVWLVVHEESGAACGVYPDEAAANRAATAANTP